MSVYLYGRAVLTDDLSCSSLMICKQLIMLNCTHKLYCFILSLQVSRVFSYILMCQAEPNGSVANVKDMFLVGGSATPMFDNNVVSKIMPFNML